MHVSTWVRFPTQAQLFSSRLVDLIFCSRPVSEQPTARKGVSGSFRLEHRLSRRLELGPDDNLALRPRRLNEFPGCDEPARPARI